MAATVVFGVLIVLIFLAVQRNHARQRYGQRGLAGSGTALDRDAERVSADAAAVPRR